MSDDIMVTSDWRCQSPGCDSTAHLSHDGPPGKRCDVCGLQNWAPILDPGVTGLPHLCPKCGASVPPAQTSQVCTECTHSLVYPYSTKAKPGDGMMGRVPHKPPTTVAEWIAQTRETGILEFDQLLAIGEITVDDVADNYARGRDDEREAIATYYAELFQRAPFSVGDMLSDIRRNQHQKVGEP